MSALLFVIGSSLVSCIVAYPNGAGPDACKNYLMPYHLDRYDRLYQRQYTRSPYTVTVGVESDLEAVMAGTEIPLKLSGPDHFQGFLLAAVAFDSNGNEMLVGEFRAGNESLNYTHTMCHGTAVTHNLEWNRAGKERSINLYWKAPQDVFSGYVVFYATFVKSFSVYWQDIVGDKAVIVAYVMSGSYIPPQEEGGYSTGNYYSTEAGTGTVEEHVTTLPEESPITEVDTTAQPITELDTTEQPVELKDTTTELLLEEMEKEEPITEFNAITTEVTEQSAVTVDITQVTEEDNLAVELEPTAHAPVDVELATAESDECAASDMNCLKKALVDGIHNLIKSLEKIQNYIDPSSTGSTSSRV